MALYVNTNVSSLNAQRQLSNVQGKLNTCYQRLASGLRINSSKDDAAGLQISDRLTSQINGLNQGNRNASDGIALLQTCEGAMDEMTNMLQRIRVLAVQAANGTNTQFDRKALQEEVTSLSHEISRIANKSTFAGANILTTKGTNNLFDAQGRFFFQVGADANDLINVSVGTMTLNAIATRVTGKATFETDADRKATGIYVSVTGKNSLARFTVSTAEFAQSTLTNIDQFIELVDSRRAALGATQCRLESVIRLQANVAENEADARSRIRDTDFASTTAELTQSSIIQQACQTIMMQANQRPSIALNLLQGIR